jgi:hypothetical protein
MSAAEAAPSAGVVHVGAPASLAVTVVPISAVAPQRPSARRRAAWSIARSSSPTPRASTSRAPPGRAPTVGCAQELDVLPGPPNARVGEVRVTCAAAAGRAPTA